MSARESGIDEADYGEFSEDSQHDSEDGGDVSPDEMRAAYFNKMDSIAAFMDDVRKIPVFTAAEEKECFCKIYEARERFFHALCVSFVHESGTGNLRAKKRAKTHLLIPEQGGKEIRIALSELNQDAVLSLRAECIIRRTLEGFYQKNRRAPSLRYADKLLKGYDLHTDYCKQLANIRDELCDYIMHKESGHWFTKRMWWDTWHASFIKRCAVFSGVPVLGGARDEIIRLQNDCAAANCRLVVSLATKYRGRGMDISDLVQEGHFGLMHAVEQYSLEVGTRFSTFAVYWIKQKIRRAIVDRAPSVPLPSYVHEFYRTFVRYKHYFEQEKRRQATKEELMEIGRRLRNKLSRKGVLGLVAPKLLEELVSGGHRGALSLNEKVDEDRPSDELVDFLEDNRFPPPFRPVEEEINREVIRRYLPLLPLRSEFIVRQRFGIGCGQSRTLGELGKILGISKERVRQFEARSLKQLRILLEQDGLNAEMFLN